jgi:phytoene dehydrogenase-like protein
MTDVAIVGAGLAGLSCACELTSRGISCTLLESSNDVGGRARTDQVGGFLLDRGFQVLLTAYPEAKRLLDYPALRLSSFEPGALVRFNGKFHRIADPWRLPSAMLSTLAAPVGTVADKLALGKLRHRLIGDSPEDQPAPETSTLQFLRNWGFSSAMIDTFFRPFLGGIFLEQELETSSRMFEFVFRMFSIGEASLPAAGMGAMAQQLAARLPQNSIRLQQPVAKLSAGGVTLASGE